MGNLDDLGLGFMVEGLGVRPPGQVLVQHRDKGISVQLGRQCGTLSQRSWFCSGVERMLQTAAYAGACRMERDPGVWGLGFSVGQGPSFGQSCKLAAGRTAGQQNEEVSAKAWTVWGHVH